MVPFLIAGHNCLGAMALYYVWLFCVISNFTVYDPLTALCPVQRNFIPGVDLSCHTTFPNLLPPLDSECKVSLYILILIHGIVRSYMCPIYVCTATLKASVGMYSGCDMLSLQILFVYFLALLHPSILFNCFLYFLLFFFYCPQGKS